MAHLEKLTTQIFHNKHISLDEAHALLSEDVHELLYYAQELRTHFKGTTVNLCAIINAKSGRCAQDCTFCSQSGYNNTSIETYDLVSKKKIVKAAHQARLAKAHCFGMVTSGHTLTDKEVDVLCSSIDSTDHALRRSASLGGLTKEQLVKLKRSGLVKFHHNLETAESFFPQVCTTHTYAERKHTIITAQEVGLEVCSGGIFGLGETKQQRIELAFALRELNVDSVPLNFLNPIKGTPLENQKKMPVFDILQTIALFRFILPTKDISVCGGREVNLGDFQSWIFNAGANGMMVGGYLTTSGRSVDKDIAMIKEQGLEIACYEP